jgi:hypothetical protein
MQKSVLINVKIFLWRSSYVKVDSHVERTEFNFDVGLAAIVEYIKIGEQKKKGINVANSETIKQLVQDVFFRINRNPV